MQRNACRHKFAERVVIVKTDVGKNLAAVLVDMHRAVGKRADHVITHRILRQSPYPVLAFGQIQLITPFETDFPRETVDGFNVIGSLGLMPFSPTVVPETGIGVSSKIHGTSLTLPSFNTSPWVGTTETGFGSTPHLPTELTPSLHELAAPNTCPSNTRQAEQQ